MHLLDPLWSLTLKMLADPQGLGVLASHIALAAAAEDLGYSKREVPRLPAIPFSPQTAPNSQYKLSQAIYHHPTLILSRVYSQRSPVMWFGGGGDRSRVA